MLVHMHYCESLPQSEMEKYINGEIFFRIYVFRFDVLQVLSCIIQFIINVAISGSESYGN